MFDPILLRPVGVVRSSVGEAVDDVWGELVSTIELDPARFSAESLQGLSDFSHVEVVFQFHAVDEARVTHGSRHPRGRTDWPKVGIFAQRAKDRPNRLGVTICRLLGVQGVRLEVGELDAIDGTPVLDVKPVMQKFLPRDEIRQPEWASELMRVYWQRGEYRKAQID